MVECKYCGGRVFDEDLHCKSCGAPAPIVKEEQEFLGLYAGTALFVPAINLIYQERTYGKKRF